MSAEQQEIMHRVESLFTLVDQIEARFKKAQVQAWPVVAMRSRLDKLTPSLLAHAFRGKLVPQDPKDESADKLFAGPAVCGLPGRRPFAVTSSTRTRLASGHSVHSIGIL